MRFLLFSKDVFQHNDNLIINVKKKLTKNFIVINGDTFFNGNLEKFLKFKVNLFNQKLNDFDFNENLQSMIIYSIYEIIENLNTF